ncbi:MAG TPA: ATP-binding protein [Propionibacteriaceae bacterium]|nr:ATP-binding protein [Propionibacteriaceae bacterium]
MEQAGVDVEIRVEGRPRPLPASLDLTAYRIVQEALTNTLKHAGPARASIVVGYDPDALRLDITDDGQAPPTTADGSGHGLPGMRERVNLYGGRLDAGPRQDGGYTVSARIPLQPAPP